MRVCCIAAAIAAFALASVQTTPAQACSGNRCPQLAASGALDPNAPLPVRAIRTTREPGLDEAAAAVLSGGSSRERTDISPSLLAATILAYLGGPALIEEAQDVPASADQFPEDARAAFAADPEAPKPSEVALEYILMTFGGALAAASAIRLFAV